MKRIIVLFCSIVLILICSAFAEIDFSQMSDDELIELWDGAFQEIVRRQSNETVLKSHSTLLDIWTCPSCGNNAVANYCSSCGMAKPNDSASLSGDKTTAEVTIQEIKTSGYFSYVVRDDNSATIVGLNKSVSDIEIPDEIDGHSVVAIGDKAFYDNNKLKKAIIPSSVTYIGSSAFSYCKKLSELELTDGLKYIGEGAFFHCDSLYDLAIPDTVECIAPEAFSYSGIRRISLGSGLVEIGDNAFSCSKLVSISLPSSIKKIGVNPFSYCEELSKIDVGPNNDYLAVINDALYSKPDKRLICYPLGCYNRNYSIPEGIEIIGAESFYFCQYYMSIKLPDSIVTIEDDAFSDSNCSDIMISKNVKNVGANPFRGISDYHITVSDDNPYIKMIRTSYSYCLYDIGHKKVICGSLIPDGAEILGAKLHYGDWYYSGEVVLPNTITTIEDEAFWFCDKLRILHLPASITYIGQDAFTYCELLSCIVEMDSYAEQYCKDNKIPYNYPNENNQDWLNQ